MENFPPNTNSNAAYSLKAKTTKKTLEGADAMLKASMNGDHKVMKTGWTRINRMLLGGFHFSQIYLIAGASGHGKSYMLNQIQRAFVSKRINNPKFTFKIMHFGFEMSAEIELLRRVSSITKIPFRKLISSDDPLNQEEYDKVRQYYNMLQDEPIYYFEQPGTRYEIEATIRNFKKKFPEDELIITLDHSLLVNSERGEDEIKTLSELGKMLIMLKKEMHICAIVLAQLNDKIEGEKRRDPTNPALHFPTKTDIHGSKQLYHAADVVMVIHQPALLNLEHYGKQNIPTQDLVAVHALKQRNGSQGFVLMENNLKHGMLTERRKDDDEKERRTKIMDALEGKKNNK